MTIETDKATIARCPNGRWSFLDDTVWGRCRPAESEFYVAAHNRWGLYVELAEAWRDLVMVEGDIKTLDDVVQSSRRSRILYNRVRDALARIEES